MATLRAGVLIIGSLLWDSRSNRPNWRKGRLDTDAAEPVPAPIRYGRVSSGRRDTHTMVFSMRCQRQDGLGVAQLVPCRIPIASERDFFVEIEALANAEGMNVAGWTWGAVGILANPSSKIPADLLSSWEAYFKRMTCGCKVFDTHLADEEPSISRSGILAVEWPTSIRSGRAVDLDLLFATATRPTLRDGCYPSPDEVAAAYVREELPEYFIENVLHGIRTAHDHRIWQTMVTARPEWNTKYAGVGETISGGR